MSVKTDLDRYYDLADGISSFYPADLSDPIIRMHLEMMTTHKQRIIKILEDKYNDDED